MGKLEEKFSEAPCCFCRYNGPGFFQAKTHKMSCPFYHVGGKDERIEFVIKALNEFRVQVYPNQVDVDKYYRD